MSLRHQTVARVGTLRQYPIDLVIVSLGAVLAYLAVSTFQDGSTLRLLVTLPLILFFPGYALLSVLFPAAERDVSNSVSAPTEKRPRGIDTVERLGLSSVLSLAVVFLVVLLLPGTEWGLRTASTTAGISVATVGLAQLGAVRRLRTPKPVRFTVSPLQTIRRLRQQESVTASSLLLVVAIGIAVGALALSVLAPATAGGFTELGLYSETEDGELVAGELPDEITANDSVSAVASVENQEGEDRDYTLVVQQQTIADDVIVDRVMLDELEISVSDGDAETVDQEITPVAETGDTVRISVLLYEDELPSEPTNENAAEDTFFWVTIAEE